MGYGLLSGEDAVQQGLGGAAGLITGGTFNPYPNFVPSQGQAPAQRDFINYTPNQPMAQVQTPNYQLNSTTPTWQNTNVNQQTVNSQNAQAGGFKWNNFTPNSAPNYQTVNTNAEAAPWQFNKFNGTTPTYQGLMGGDYNALQTALQQPGEIAARTAYDQGQNNLQTQMGGRGLYGSSVMANQARTALDTPYQNALATNAANAAATRYGMQATDLQNQNNFGLNVYGQQMGENTTGQQLGLNYAGLQTDVNKQNVANSLAQATNLNNLASSDAQQVQGLMANQNLAQNSAGLDYAKMLTQNSQFNAGNNLSAQQGNQNANTANNSLLMNQGLAQNAQNMDVYGQQMAQNQNMNAYNLNAAQLGMQQNQNTYNAGVSDAARQQDYNLNAMNYGNQGTEAQRQWANQQALEKMQYDLASNQYSDAQRTQRINEYLALAGRGQVTSGQNQAAIQAANANATASQNGWLGALGAGVGLMGANNNAGWSALGDGLSSGYNWLTA